jgi:hypothetical protein
VHTLTDHISIAFLIMLPVLVIMVDRAIALNHQRCLIAIEVRNVITELVLSPELASMQLPIAEKLPQQIFCRRFFIAQLTR